MTEQCSLPIQYFIILQISGSSYHLTTAYLICLLHFSNRKVWKLSLQFLMKWTKIYKVSLLFCWKHRLSFSQSQIHKRVRIMSIICRVGKLALCNCWHFKITIVILFSQTWKSVFENHFVRMCIFRPAY